MRLAVGQAAKADGSSEDGKELNGAFESAAGGEGQSHTERFVSGMPDAGETLGNMGILWISVCRKALCQVSA